MEPKMPEMGSKNPQEILRLRLMEIVAELERLGDMTPGEPHVSDEVFKLMEEQAEIEKKLGIHTE